MLLRNRLVRVTVLLAAILATASSARAESAWLGRADAETAQLLQGDNAASVAAEILGRTHPTGEAAFIRGVQIRHVGETLSVRIAVGWKGGLIGTAYVTSVAWEFDRHQHVQAVVVADSAPVGVSRKNAFKLDQYFRNELYPILRNNLGQ